MKLISIIIPIYNVKLFLKDCLDSVLRQTYANLEIILVDDGSTDGSDIICDEYAKTDSRIIVIHQPNGGLSAARNSGSNICKGDYLMFLDSDDIIRNDCIEILMNMINASKADIAVCKYSTFTGDKAAVFAQTGTLCSRKANIRPKALSAPNEDSGASENIFHTISGREAALEVVHFHKRHFITAWGKLYSRTLLPLLSYPVGRIHEDEFVTYQVLYSATKVAVTNIAGIGYRIRPESIMNSNYSDKKAKDALAGIFSAIQWFNNKNEMELMQYAKLRYLLNIEMIWYKAYKSMAHGQDRNALLKYLKETHIQFFKENEKDLSGLCSLPERISITIFRMSPVLYGLFAYMYFKLNLND